MDKSLLIGYISVIHNSEETIHISNRASGHRMCAGSNYIIKPKEEMMLEFQSLVNTRLIVPLIQRSITLQNIKTGESRSFKFSAQFMDN